MTQALRLIRERAEMALLALIMIVVVYSSIRGSFLLKTMPRGLFGVGIVDGMSLTLHAIGVVLVYRSNRIINFAQVQIGTTAATFFSIMVNYTPIFTLVNNVCPVCMSGGLTNTQYKVNYVISIVLAVLLSMLLSFAIYTFVVKRFANAPRLVLTIATIFLVQLLGAVQGFFSWALITEEQRERGIALGAARFPRDWDHTFKGGLFSPAQFHMPDLIKVVVALAAVALLIMYFRYSGTGIAIRASAENAPRAETLGINVNGVTSRVWIIAGLLSGAAAITSAMASGVGGGGGGTLNVSETVDILAVAVIARMASLPIAVTTAIVFGIFQQSVQWSYESAEPVLNGLMLVIIAVILMVQRYRVSRAEIEQASQWRPPREIRPVPKELKPLPVVRKWYRIASAIGILLLLGFPWFMSPSQINLWSLMMIYAIIVVSLLVLTGWAGQISLGHFAFAAIGGYIAALVTGTIPFPFSLLLGGLVGAIVAVLVGVPALKLRGLHLAITTMAFASATTSILLNARLLGKFLPSQLKSPKIFGLDLESQRTLYYFIFVFMVLAIFGVVGMRRSRTGRALIASRDNEQAAQSFGINLLIARLGAFAVSGFFAAFAGGLYAFHQHGVKAESFTPEQSITMFVIAVMGGLGSVASVLIGVIYYGFLTLASNNVFVQQGLNGGGGLVILMLFGTGGLGQMVFNIRDAILRRVAMRNNIIVPSLLADMRMDKLGKPRAIIAPKLRSGGGSVFIPRRYELEGQWALAGTEAEESEETPELAFQLSEDDDATKEEQETRVG